jgi:hypothetical protein
MMPTGDCVDCPYPLRCEGNDKCVVGARGVGCGTCGEEQATYAPEDVFETDYENIGSYGGTCTCPNGGVYQVGVYQDGGTSGEDSCDGGLACIGGESGGCSSNNPGGMGVKVNCGPEAGSFNDLADQLFGVAEDDTIKYYNSYGTCEPCPDDGVFVPVLIVMVFVSAGMLVLFRLTTVSKTVNTEATEGAIKVLGSTATIAFGHLQMAVHILTLPSVQWPKFLQEVMQFLRNIAFISIADFVRPECQVPGGMDPALEFLLKYALKQLLFAALFGVFLAVHILGRVRAGTTGGLGTQYHGTNCMVALYSIFFLLLVQSNFAVWDCSRQAAVLEGSCSDGISTTEADCPCEETWTDPAESTFTLDEFPEMECYGFGEGLKRNVWLGVAVFSAISLITYIVVLPCFFLNKLGNAKKEGTLTDYKVKAQYGWLFTRYNYNACTYYEFLFMARKSLVILLGMFISSVQRRPLMLTCTAIILTAALALNVLLRPYSDHELTEADAESNGICKMATGVLLPSTWSLMDVLDTIGLICALICLACAVYFVGDCHRRDAPCDERGICYVEICVKREEGTNETNMVTFIALFCALVPIVLGIWSAYLARRKKNRGKAEAQEFGEYDNPVADDDE